MYGCEGNILQLLKLPDGTVKVLVEGNKRVKILDFKDNDKFIVCEYSALNDIINKDELLKSLNSDLKSCKNVDFTIFGLSLAAINFLLSFLICILILKVLKNEKNK